MVSPSLYKFQAFKSTAASSNPFYMGNLYDFMKYACRNRMFTMKRNEWMQFVGAK